MQQIKITVVNTHYTGRGLKLNGTHIACNSSRKIPRYIFTIIIFLINFFSSFFKVLSYSFDFHFYNPLLPCKKKKGPYFFLGPYFESKMEKIQQSINEDLWLRW